MDSSYFRITYKSKNHGYWEDIIPEDEDQRNSLYSLVLKCRKEGAIPSKDGSVRGFVEVLQQGNDYPRSFIKDPVLTVYIEFHTVTAINEFEAHEPTKQD
jgi:hypothetical protein